LTAGSEGGGSRAAVPTAASVARPNCRAREGVRWKVAAVEVVFNPRAGVTAARASVLVAVEEGPGD
jgi:hypothetical protein